MTRLPHAAWALALLAAACDDGGGSDAGVAGDGGGGDGGAEADARAQPCSAPAGGWGDLGALAGTAERITGGGGMEEVRFVAALDATAAPDRLEVQLWRGFTVFAGGIVPGTYSLAGAELNLESCGVCVLVRGDDGAQVLFATGGTVEVTDVTDRFAATLTDVTLEHVTVDPNTQHSTPVADGCAGSISAASWDAPM